MIDEPPCPRVEPEISHEALGRPKCAPRRVQRVMETCDGETLLLGFICTVQGLAFPFDGP
ncbi:MAG: hypothetical protein QOJ76_580 [Acidobacteriota bacterium]|jgi:hypothetical protein|nr:hypothetical protein [Acidobacteriota bacterium]